MARLILDTFGPLPRVVRVHNVLPGWLQPVLRERARKAQIADLQRAGITVMVSGGGEIPFDVDQMLMHVAVVAMKRSEAPEAEAAS